MIGRVTQFSLQRSSLQHLQSNLSRMGNLQEQLSSGKKLSRPSDDPAGTVDAMRIRADQRAAAQHERNVTNGISWLSTIDSTLLQLSPRVADIKERVIAASNDSLSDVQRHAIAVELDAIAEELVGMANTTYLGRSVFAGTSSAGAAYEVGTDPVTGRPTYTYTGTPGSSVERRISETTTVRVDSDGLNVFGDGEDSLFALVNAIADDLRNGNPVGGRIDEVESFFNAIQYEIGTIGTRYNQANNAKEAIADRKVALTSQLVSVEDIDLPATIVELGMQEVAYNAALSATARVLQPTLLDFLR